MNGFILIKYIRSSNYLKILSDGDLSDKVVATNVLLSHLEQILVKLGINPADYYRALHTESQIEIESNDSAAAFFNPIRDGFGDGEVKFFINELGVVSISAAGLGLNDTCRVQMILDVIRSFLMENRISWNDFWCELEAEVRDRLKVNRWPILNRSKLKRKRPSN